MTKYNFVFDGNKTNECIAHGRLFTLTKYEFAPNYRVDITDNKGFMYSDNTGNDSFRKVVDLTKSINEQINIWANFILEQYTICDICGNLEMVLPLASYDLESFPQLKNKKVCDKCRTNFFIESLNKLQDEEINEQKKLKSEMKQKGAKFQYAFWVHPNKGDDFAVDMFVSKKLTVIELNKERKKLITKYSARLVEEPIFTIL